MSDGHEIDVMLLSLLDRTNNNNIFIRYYYL